MTAVLREIDGRLVSSRLLTYEDAAAYLSVSEKTLERLIKAHKIRRRRVGLEGGLPRIDVEDLDRLIDSLPTEAEPDPSHRIRSSGIPASVLENGESKVISLGKGKRT